MFLFLLLLFFGFVLPTFGSHFETKHLEHLLVLLGLSAMAFSFFFATKGTVFVHGKLGRLFALG